MWRARAAQEGGARRSRILGEIALKRRISTFLSVRLFNPLVRHAARAACVRNIEGEPRLRIQLGRRWRSGVAQAVPDDDPIARLRTMPRIHATSVRAMGSELLSVRIDLEKQVDAKVAA